MRYRRVGLAIAVGLGLVAAVRADDKPAATHVHRSAEMEKCIHACLECANQCETCFVHCTNLVASGKKEHVKTLKSCLDCGDLCAIATKIMIRDGALIGPACAGCSKACDACAAVCEKYPTDEHMKACAKACRECSKACTEMEKSIQTAVNSAPLINQRNSSK